jgi:hypothetical protein
VLGVALAQVALRGLDGSALDEGEVEEVEHEALGVGLDGRVEAHRRSSRGVTRSVGEGRWWGQATWSERMELPNQVPVAPEVADRPVVVLAPMVSNSGTKCSGVACATSTPGPLWR